ncbi:hypothetical protein B7494_g4890 [Chlorociboria aeruginascens]|nr:hypothetical protein B7494_g4890 [Chlorociboria aeruginascens]
MDEIMAMPVAELEASKLQVTKTTIPSEAQDPVDLPFGKRFTGMLENLPPTKQSIYAFFPQVAQYIPTVCPPDHMLRISWSKTSGWSNPEIVPFQQLLLDPSCSGLNYAVSCFEGMKAYKDPNGEIRLFRPGENLRRLSSSAARIMLPRFDESELLKCIATLVDMDKRFLNSAHPKRASLYLRPNLIGTSAGLGVGFPTEALLYVIASPAGSYFDSERGPDSGPRAISLLASSDLDATRAWYGGAGNYKVAANYAPTIAPQLQAETLGFQQVLWVVGDNTRVTEAGTTNFFAVLMDNSNSNTGRFSLVTPPTDGLILPGITRDCVLSLARERLEPKGWTIAEREITMKELSTAAKEGSLIEAFGTGTAATVVSIRNIVWGGGDVGCGLADGQEMGEVAGQMKSWIEAIQYGEQEHEWSVLLQTLL